MYQNDLIGVLHELFVIFPSPDDFFNQGLLLSIEARQNLIPCTPTYLYTNMPVRRSWTLIHVKPVN